MHGCISNCRGTVHHYTTRRRRVMWITLRKRSATQGQMTSNRTTELRRCSTIYPKPFFIQINTLFFEKSLYLVLKTLFLVMFLLVFDIIYDSISIFI